MPFQISRQSVGMVGMSVVLKEIQPLRRGMFKSQVRLGALVRFPLIGVNRKPLQPAQGQSRFSSETQKGLAEIGRKQPSGPQEGQGECPGLSG